MYQGGEIEKTERATFGGCSTQCSTGIRVRTGEQIETEVFLFTERVTKYDVYVQ